MAHLYHSYLSVLELEWDIYIYKHQSVIHTLASHICYSIYSFTPSYVECTHLPMGYNLLGSRCRPVIS